MWYLVVLTLLVGFVWGCAPASPPAAGGAQPSAGGAAKPQAQQTVKVAQVSGFTGFAADEGAYYKQLMELALEEINTRNAAGGVRLEGVYLDNESGPRQSVTAMRQAVDTHQAPIVLSGYTSPLLAMAPIADETKTLLVNCYAIGPTLAGAAEYLLNAIPLATQDGKVVADYAYKQGQRRLAITYSNNDYGRAMLEAVKRDFTGLGGQVVSEESHEVGAQDFATQVTKMRAAAPDAVYVGATTNQDTAAFIRHARDVGLTAQFYAAYNADLGEATRRVAGDAYEGMIFTTPFAVPDSVDQAYQQKYGQSAKGVSSTGSAFYDCSYLVAAIFERAAKQGYPLTGEGLRRALTELNQVAIPSGSTFVLNPDLTVRKEIYVKLVRGGEKETVLIVKP